MCRVWARPSPSPTHGGRSVPLRGRELGHEEVRGGVRQCGLDELENSVDQGRLGAFRPNVEGNREARKSEPRWEKEP